MRSRAVGRDGLVWKERWVEYWTGLGWIGLDWIGLDWIGLAWFVLCCKCWSALFYSVLWWFAAAQNSRGPRAIMAGVYCRTVSKCLRCLRCSMRVCPEYSTYHLYVQWSSFPGLLQVEV